MFSFKNDYSEGIHPGLLPVIETLSKESVGPYGEDIYSDGAKEVIKKLTNCPDAEIAFISGGTTTNVLAISTLLRNSYEAVITASTGHINVHETGAIEYSGHKVIEVLGDRDGKLTTEMIKSVLDTHESEHMVEPRLCYISDTTENGGVYTKKELTELSEFCHDNGLLLYLDGARLGAALTAPSNDLTLSDIASLTDAFYIGGTKNGLLFGEALVFTSHKYTDHLRSIIKNHGFMLAKGFVLGIMFKSALEGGLYFDMAKNSIDKAMKIADCINKTNIQFYTKPVSNQLFICLPDDKAKLFEKEFGCNVDYDRCLAKDGMSRVRIVTSWATTDEGVNAICELIKKVACS